MPIPPYFVYFLPWLSLNQEIIIGPISFWPYFESAAGRIANSQVKAYLDRLFACFVDHRGEPVKTIAICSYENIDFQIFNEDQHPKLTWALDALIFSSIIEPTSHAVISNNRHNPPPSSNMFELRYQAFGPGSDHMSHRAGNVSHLGLRIGEFSFSQPWTTGGMFFVPRRNTVEGLSRCVTANIPEDLRLRIFRSLQWFKLAHAYDEAERSQTENLLPRVVMMGTGFEILLDFPSGMGKSDYFANYIEREVAHRQSARESRSVRNQQKDLSLAACWAYDFYKLRNKVVHGDQVLPNELLFKAGHWLTHLIVADLVFEECLRRILFHNRLTGERAYSLAQEFGGKSEDWLWLERFNRYHKALGWNQSDNDESE
jgi:hypothetical protein